MGQQERAIVKAKLFGKEGGTMKAEDFNPAFKDAASDSLAKALFKVFVEGTEKEQEPISLTYVEEMDTAEHRKYKVRVTDKNTKKSYVRYATREKINQLRANPNIESVEMTGYGEPYEGEKKKGSQTARVAAGKGLDPVGQEDKDIDNDGDHDKTDKYLLNRRKVRGSAIATRKEEFIHEAETEDSNTKKIDVMKKGKKNKVCVAPEQGKGLGLMAHNELEGEVIVETGYEKFLKKVHSLQEKAVSQNQQQLAGMALAYLRGEMPDASDEVKKMAKMGEKKLRDFAKTKHEGLPEKVKEECECEDEKKSSKSKKGEMDVRQIPTSMNLAKNKLRAMGLKMSYEPEGEQIDEFNLFGRPTVSAAGGKGGKVTVGRTYPAMLGGNEVGVQYGSKGEKKIVPPAGSAKPAGKAAPSAAPTPVEKPTIEKNLKKRYEPLKQVMDMSSYEPEGELVDEQEYTVITTGGERKTAKKPIWKASPAAAVQPIETTGPKKSLPFPISSRYDF